MRQPCSAALHFGKSTTSSTTLESLQARGRQCGCLRVGFPLLGGSFLGRYCRSDVAAPQPHIAPLPPRSGSQYLKQLPGALAALKRHQQVRLSPASGDLLSGLQGVDITSTSRLSSTARHGQAAAARCSCSCCDAVLRRARQQGRGRAEGGRPTKEGAAPARWVQRARVCGSSAATASVHGPASHRLLTAPAQPKKDPMGPLRLCKSSAGALTQPRCCAAPCPVRLHPAGAAAAPPPKPDPHCLPTHCDCHCKTKKCCAKCVIDPGTKQLVCAKCAVGWVKKPGGVCARPPPPHPKPHPPPRSHPRPPPKRPPPKPAVLPKHPPPKPVVVPKRPPPPAPCVRCGRASMLKCASWRPARVRSGIPSPQMPTPAQPHPPAACRQGSLRAAPTPNRNGLGPTILNWFATHPPCRLQGAQLGQVCSVGPDCCSGSCSSSQCVSGSACGCRGAPALAALPGLACLPPGPGSEPCLFTAVAIAQKPSVPLHCQTAVPGQCGIDWGPQEL